MSRCRGGGSRRENRDTSDIIRLKTQTQIDDEAAAWTWRADAGELSPAERGRLEAWLREDVRHRRTFEELSRTWTALDGLSERPREYDKVAAFARVERGACWRP